MSRSVVVGSNGFIGTELLAQLIGSGEQAVGIQRQPAQRGQQNIVVCDNLVTLSAAKWRELFKGIEVVYFVAGFAHSETADDSLLLINSETPSIAFEVANENCVRKFIWLSSIQVLGNTSPQPLNNMSTPNPQNKYAASKLAGESSLLVAAEGVDTELAIVRPPLVYGPGVKGNFLALLTKVYRGGWLPLGRVKAVRSLVAVENLCDFIIQLSVSSNPSSNDIWHVRDAEIVTIATLIRTMQEEFGSRLHLIPVPEKLLEWVLRITGRDHLVERLLRNLEVDQSASCEQLEWQPPIQFVHALRRTVQWYQQQV